MELTFMMVAAAFGGGMFGAAIGGLPAFVFTGFAVLAGTGLAMTGASYDFLGNVAFGPVFGPHIAFAGGAAAAAYARKRGELEDGKDIVTPLASLATADVYVVGGIAGVIGLLIVSFLNIFLEGYMDVIAFVVFLTGIMTRIAFGETGTFGTVTDPEHTGGRFKPGGVAHWVEYQEGWTEASVLGVASGLISAFMAITILDAFPEAAGIATVIGFGISAASLLFLALGLSFPVTHHMTISAGYAAVALHGAGPTVAILGGAAAGLAAGVLGELGSRLFLIHGDSHIDPPAFAIFIMSAIFLVPVALAG